MNYIYLSVRVLHVLCGALWLGGVVLISMFLMPALQQSGPEGGAIMGRMQKRGLVVFMSSISGVAILSGFWLYWRFTGGFDAAISASTAGKVFGTGGLLGLAAGIIGGAVVGRSAKKAAELGAKMATAPEGKDRAALTAEIGRLRQRMVTWGNLVIVLLVGALALMTIGHYV